MSAPVEKTHNFVEKPHPNEFSAFAGQKPFGWTLYALTPCDPRERPGMHRTSVLGTESLIAA